MGLSLVRQSVVFSRTLQLFPGDGSQAPPLSEVEQSRGLVFCTSPFCSLWLEIMSFSENLSLVHTHSRTWRVGTQQQRQLQAALTPQMLLSRRQEVFVFI